MSVFLPSTPPPNPSPSLGGGKRMPPQQTSPLRGEVGACSARGGGDFLRDVRVRFFECPSAYGIPPTQSLPLAGGREEGEATPPKTSPLRGEVGAFSAPGGGDLLRDVILGQGVSRDPGIWRRTQTALPHSFSPAQPNVRSRFMPAKAGTEHEEVYWGAAQWLEVT